jgi:monoamine oxidase
VTAGDGSERVDVVVIGAGFAGLRATALLAEAGASVVVLEARKRVGGRVESEPVGEGATVELGASWVTDEHVELLALAGELGLRVEPMWSDGATVVLTGEKRALISDKDGEAVAPEAPAAIAALDQLAARVDPAAPWDAADAASCDRTTLGAWLDQNVPGKSARVALELGAEGYFARPSAEVPLLHALFYARSNGGFDHLLGATGDPLTQSLVGGGVQAIATGVAERLGDAVRLGRPVLGLSQSRAGVTAMTDSERVEARRAIVALPPPLAQRIPHEPPVPWDRDQLTQRWSMGSGWKCHLVYPEAFWRGEGLNGRVIDAGDGTTAFDTSPPGGVPGILTAFLPVASVAEHASAGPDGRRAVLVSVLERALGRRATEADAYRDRMWWCEPFSRGDVAVPTLGTWTSFGAALREPVGLIHWAGTETAIEFAGQMEGALRSGRRAAEEVLALL